MVNKGQFVNVLRILYAHSHMKFMQHMREVQLSYDTWPMYKLLQSVTA